MFRRLLDSCSSIVQSFAPICLMSTAAVFLATPRGIAQDCNNNGIPDIQDVDPTDPDGDGEISNDCNANGRPDECDLAGPRLIGATHEALLEIDRDTAAPTILRTLDLTFRGLTHAPSRNALIAATGSTLHEIDISSLAITAIGTIGSEGIAFDSLSDRLFLSFDTSIVEFDFGTGQVAPVASLDSCCLSGMAYDADTNRLIAMDNDPCTAWLIDIEAGTGTDMASFDPCFESIVYDTERHVFWGCQNQYFGSSGYHSMLHHFNPDTGSHEQVGPMIQGRIEGLAFIPGSHDVNADGIPDECQGDAGDCNGNGVLDEHESAFLDVALFSAHLSAATANSGVACLFDTNQDGLLDGRDIRGFVERLLST